MDSAIFHSWYTVLLLVIFVAIVIWAYSSKRKKRFDEAANLPFADEQPKSSKTDTQRRDEEQAR